MRKRQEQLVMVPALVGLNVQQAQELAQRVGLVVVAADPIEPLPASGTVTAQQPRAGFRASVGDEITVLAEAGPGGGGGGGGRLLIPPPPGPREPAGTK